MLVVSILESDRRRGHILPIVLQLCAFAWTKYTFFVHDFIFVVLEMSRFILTVNMGGGKGGQGAPNFRTTKSVVSANAQSRFVSTVSWDLRSQRSTPKRCPQLPAVLEATHKSSLGPLKGAVSALKALQGSRPRRRSYWEELKRTCSPLIIAMVYAKKQTEKIMLVTRHGV